MSISSLLVAGGHAAVTSAISYYVTIIVPEPYMDEIFHIPQAQKYCQGKFREVRPEKNGAKIRVY